MSRLAQSRSLALVTGASSGIGYELALLCAKNGYDLVLAAEERRVYEAAEAFRSEGVNVDALEIDLSTARGVDAVMAMTGGRRVDVLMANAGHGLGHGFLDQEFDDVLHIINTNVVATLCLIHTVARGMRARGSGRVLITGPIAGLMPGTYQAVYNGTKAFIDSFSFALRAELKDTGVTVTCLMPGARETDFFERAGLMDTKVGQSRKDAPADVAKVGFDAMMRGDGDVVSGWQNKLRAAIAAITPSGVLAEIHRGMTQPRSELPSHK